MQSKIKNAREINIRLIYNTKRVEWHFKIDKGKEEKLNWELASKMFCCALSCENAVAMRMLLRQTYDLMIKKDKIYFKKLNKLNNV